MKGTTNPILKSFDGSHNEIFIPVYQRNYDWQLKQCERLFQDLEEIIEVNRKKHFFGAVVGKPETNWTWVVIDGQQRLTTVSILMLALAHSLRDGDIESEDGSLARKIEQSYLRIGDDKQETRFKLKPVKDDDKAYRRLFGPEKDFIASSNITSNYKYFRERLAGTALNADQVWDAIQRLEVMHLDLEDFDDAQRIFESLNSTGLELKEADKIRNFVLMGHESDKQTRLYENRWNPIEENTGFETDAFIRWFLTTKTSRTPREQDVYEAFKSYVTSRKISSEEVLDDLLEYSGYYRKLNEASTGNEKVDALLRRMNYILGAVTIPFLMPVLRAVESGETTYDDFYNVLKIIESFITRRYVVGIPTNSLNKIFATAISEVKKLRTDDQPMADIFAYTILRRTGAGRFPNDAEFREGFSTRNMYSLRQSWREYIFDVLENGSSNDTRDVAGALHNGKISIEHIMPQTLTNHWREDLGPHAEEIHETWLHRIGNLTVTGYNASYSNSSFEQKKTAQNGFNDTPYRLNDELKASDKWGVEEMRSRTQRFAEAAVDYWAVPETDFVPPATVLPTEAMGEEGSFTNRALVSFEYDELRKTVGSWAEMVQELVAYLMRDHRTEILAAVSTMSQLRAVSANSTTPKNWRRVDDGLIVLTGSSTEEKMVFLRALFEKLELNPDELVFSLRPTKDDERAELDAPSSNNGEHSHELGAENEFAPITKYQAQLEEAASLKSPIDQTAGLREQFVKDFDQFALVDAVAVLGNTPVGDFIAAKEPSDTSTSEVLAVITQIINASAMLGQNYLHERIVDGTLAAWTGQLLTPEPA